MPTNKRPSMRNTLSGVDPTTQGGSLAGTMAPSSTTTDQTASPMPPTTQAQASPSTNTETPGNLSEDDWYQLLHNLGSAMQRAHPDIEAALQQMSPGIDYQKEMAALQQQVANRKTPAPPSPFKSFSMAFGSPEGARLAENQTAQANAASAKKASDLEDVQNRIVEGHISDLERKGKFQEALATLLLQRGISTSQQREKDQAMLEREKLKGQNALNTARERAQHLADTFHFDERMRLKLLDMTGKIAQSKLQKYGSLDPVTGGFTIKPEQYQQWQDETMAEVYEQAAALRGNRGSGQTPPAKKADPLGIR